MSVEVQTVSESDATGIEAPSPDESFSEDSLSFTRRVMEQMASFNQLVVGGVTLAIGILVYNQVIGSLPQSSGAINQTPISSTVEAAFQLAPVALIVLIAAVILMNVSRFGGGGRGGM